MWQPFLLSLIIASILGFILIPLLRRLRYGQTVRDDGPQSHLYKTGIPVMGGFIFIIPICIISLVYTKDMVSTAGIIIAMLLYTGVGFIDDFLKISRKNKDGLSVLQKTILLLVISSAYSVYSVLVTEAGNEMIIPFSAMQKSIVIPEFIYIPFLIIFLYLITNSVNLTDGVDGLAGSVTGIVLLFFFMVAKAAGEMFVNEQLIALTAIAAIIGFLFFNAHPAKVIMGDTGSMALGGLVGVLAIQMQIPWVILIAGLIYVVESLSVIIQVGHYKRTRRRVFKMAPIHHHFELKGWPEPRVIVRFWIITFILVLVGLATLKLR